MREKKTFISITWIIVFVMALSLAACGQSAEKAVNPQIGAVESTNEVEGDEEKIEMVEETDGEKSEGTETAEGVEVKEEVEVEEPEEAEEAYLIGKVVAEKEFLNYVNERRAEAGLDSFVWDDELFDITSERVLEYVEKNSPPEHDGIWAAGLEMTPKDADFAKMFESYSDVLLNSVEGYVADAAAVGSYYSGSSWYWIFDANLASKYTYTEMDETIYYAINSVNVRAQPSTDGTKLTSLVKGETVKVIAQCNETGWYRIQDKTGGTGYVSNNYLSTQKPATQVASSNSDSSSDSASTNDSDSMSYEEFLEGLFGADSFVAGFGTGSMQEWDSARLLPDILTLVNNARAEAGVGALTWDSNLDGDAMRRAVEISSNFVHENVPSDCGENIHCATSGSDGLSAEHCFNSWWNSPGHHDNMLNARYTRISVAIYFDGNMTYASMLLGL